jgi:hypothetical protein
VGDECLPGFVEILQGQLNVTTLQVGPAFIQGGTAQLTMVNSTGFAGRELVNLTSPTAATWGVSTDLFVVDAGTLSQLVFLSSGQFLRFQSVSVRARLWLCVVLTSSQLLGQLEFSLVASTIDHPCPGGQISLPAGGTPAGGGGGCASSGDGGLGVTVGLKVCDPLPCVDCTALQTCDALFGLCRGAAFVVGTTASGSSNNTDGPHDQRNLRTDADGRSRCLGCGSGSDCADCGAAGSRCGRLDRAVHAQAESSIRHCHKRTAARQPAAGPAHQRDRVSEVSNTCDARLQVLDRSMRSKWQKSYENETRIEEGVRVG